MEYVIQLRLPLGRSFSSAAMLLLLFLKTLSSSKYLVPVVPKPETQIGDRKKVRYPLDYRQITKCRAPQRELLHWKYVVGGTIKRVKLYGSKGGASPPPPQLRLVCEHDFNNDASAAVEE